MAKKRKIVASLAEQAYARTLLIWLNTHYSRRINTNDPFLIYAIAAWLHAADKEWPNRLRKNNPFGVTDSNGKLIRFRSIRDGLIGAAKMLVAQTRNNSKYVVDASGKKVLIRANSHTEISLFKGALNALKLGGNTGAQQFLIWLAFTSWSPTHYGWDPGEDPTNPENNRLLSWYYRFGGMEQRQTTVTRTKRKVVKIPRGPDDVKPPVLDTNYIDPYAVLGFYRARHTATGVLPPLDESMAAE
jgi:hypothetical protein